MKRVQGSNGGLHIVDSCAGLGQLIDEARPATCAMLLTLTSLGDHHGRQCISLPCGNGSHDGRSRGSTSRARMWSGRTSTPKYHTRRCSDTPHLLAVHNEHRGHLYAPTQLYSGERQRHNIQHWRHIELTLPGCKDRTMCLRQAASGGMCLCRAG